MPGRTVLIGTTKGAFLLAPGAGGWEVAGPFCGGWPVNHVIGDPGTGRLWAAGGNAWTGAGIWRSGDGGGDWTLARLSRGEFDAFLEADPAMAEEFGLTPAPPAPFDGAVEALWSLAVSDGRLLAGAKPAALFASDDRGVSWERVRGLSDHPSADDWQPGGAGLVLHTIVTAPGDPGKLWVGISAAGVFATEDGGATWERRNRLSNAGDGAAAEVGHCVHNFVRAPSGGDMIRAPSGGDMIRAPGSDGDLLYQQNHQGVFRSPDGGRSWSDVAAGLPSRFGFPVAVHPRDPDTLWVLPLNGDMQGRYPPDAAAAVWRSRDGGETWTALREGLPQRACFFTVLRQAMAVDGEGSVWFGTNGGSVFCGAEEGARWSEVARHLPTVLSVEVLERD